MWNALCKYYEMYECMIEKSYIDMEYIYIFLYDDLHIPVLSI